METIKYFSIRDFNVWNNVPEDATQLDRCENFMSYYYGKSMDEIRQIPKDKVIAEYTKISEILEQTSSPIFYPIIEIDGVLHGYVDLSQMTLGEYVDLEKLVKEPNKNLAQIMAIMYRPITEHKFNSLEYKIVNAYKVGAKQMTNIWDYYTLEPYNYSTSVVNTETMHKFPVAFALGALSFFLLQTSLIAPSIMRYSEATTAEKKKKVLKNSSKEMQLTMKGHSVNIGDGLVQFIISRKHPCLTLQGISVSQISTTSLFLTGSRLKKTLHILKDNVKNKLKTKTDIKLNN